MILLKPPAGFRTNDVSGAMVMPDCTTARPNVRGYYDFSERPHLVDHFLRQGWTKFDPKPEVKFADEFEREAAEHPLDARAIIEMARTEEVTLKVDRGKLYFRPVNFASRRLVAHLKSQRDKVISELTRRAAVR